jgi:hypothetical protein
VPTERASAGGAKSTQTSAAKIAAGGTHPPRRLQMFAKRVALSPLPRLSFASLRTPCPTLASMGEAREAQQ